MINKVSRNDMRKERHSRIRTSLYGTSEKPRLNVFRSNANITAQIIDDEKGVTLVSASTLEKELNVKNGGNVEAAKLIGAEIAKRMIRELTFKPEVGMILKGKVVRIIPIGAFVELGGGKDGMVHISQVCNERIETIEPHLNIWDEAIVKIIKIDEKGRVNLTIKGVTDEEKAQFN